MNITRKQITTAVLGTALVIPCLVVGKFVGVALGAMVGSLGAYTLADKTYDLVAKKFVKKEDWREISAHATR